MATKGTATLDFGAFPGKSDASVVVTGQSSILAGSYVEAWIRPVATVDHTSDEHMVESIKVFAADIVAGTGFTIYGFNTGTLNEPVENPPGENSIFTSSATAIGIKNAPPARKAYGGGMGTRIYGTWTVAWVWD